MEQLLALDKVFVAIIGLLGGITGSLIAPWVNWGIEKRKIRRAERYQLTNKALEYTSSKQFGVIQYTKKTYYHSLRYEFSKEATQKFDNFLDETLKGINVAANRESARKLVLDEICRIKKKWFLI